MKPLQLDGLVAAVFTPFTKSGALCLPRVQGAVEELVAEGIAGLFVAGSTGEGPSLTREERQGIAGAYVEAAAGRLPVLVHVGHNSVGEACTLARHAAEIGADAISAVPPSYFKPHDLDALVDTYAEIAGAAPELPFYGYHIPGLTGVDFDPAQLLLHASVKIESFVGIKYSVASVEHLGRALEVAADRGLEVLWGCDERLLPALELGVRAAVGSTYNFAAPVFNRVLSAFAASDLELAAMEQERACRLIDVLLEYRGLPAFKGLMGLLGRGVGPSRLPLHTLSTDELSGLLEALEGCGFFRWGGVGPSPAAEVGAPDRP